MERPLISVVLPAYNAEKYIQKSIDSILAQTYNQIELIVINDGSTDTTENIIRAYDDYRIRYIKNTKNIGLIKSLNKGIEEARGKYIARMDSDDICFPTRFEEQIKVLEADQEIGVVSCKSVLIDEEDRILHGSRTMFATTYKAIYFIMAFDCVILHPGVMAKAELLKQYKYRDIEETQCCEDYDLWTRLLKDGIIIKSIDKILMKYRINLSGISKQNSSKQNRNGKWLSMRYQKSIFKDKLQEKSYTILAEENSKWYKLELIKKCYNIYKDQNNLKKIEQNEICLWLGKYFLELIRTCGINLRYIFKNLEIIFYSIKYIILVYQPLK